jgi:hypothetical protein
MEIFQNNELQAIFGRNDILGENPCNTMTPGKSRCVVRGRFFFCREDFLLFKILVFEIKV